nr:outer membrane protein OmpK [Pseudomonas luteola]
MSRALSSVVLASGLLLTGNAMADGMLHWQDNSLTYLYGQNYKVDPDTQQTITFEHASDWSWGDIWFFVDNSWYNGVGRANANGHHSYYGEFSPRFSLGKLTGTKLELGPITDVLLATTYEFGEGDVDSYLIGPGFDLKVPGFNFFTLNFYYRKPEGSRVRSGAWQVTPAWSITLPAGTSDILFDGYIDWVVSNRNDNKTPSRSYHANFHFNPQIKYDLGKAMGYEAKHMYVGVEYDYWSDKYGIKDSHAFRTDQNTFSVIAKYHF